jgi:3-isopropylmalate/(R)-2-methylmalate dehydratase small subunit
VTLENDEMATREIKIIEGRAIPVVGHDIDTDRIMPARFLKAISFEGLERNLFEDDRAALRAKGGVHPFDNPAFQAASVLVVNRNFGCGSSREHAPQALRRWGIRAVVGESFSEIFFGNSLALGMPCLAVSGDAAEALQDQLSREPQTVVQISVPDLRVSWRPPPDSKESDTSRPPGSSVEATLPRSAREALMSGVWDATGLLLDHPEQVERVAARLPYVQSFDAR